MTVGNINDIPDDGISVEVEYSGPIGGEGIVPTGEAVTPGAIVEYTTTEGEIDECGADSTQAIGYAVGNVRADDPAVGTESDLRTDYGEGERFSYRNEYGDVFWGILADQSGVDVEPGTVLKTAAGGELTPLASADNADVKGVAEMIEDDAVAPSGSNRRTLVRWVA